MPFWLSADDMFENILSFERSGHIRMHVHVYCNVQMAGMSAHHVLWEKYRMVLMIMIFFYKIRHLSYQLSFIVFGFLPFVNYMSSLYSIYFSWQIQKTFLYSAFIISFSLWNRSSASLSVLLFHKMYYFKQVSRVGMFWPNPLVILHDAKFIFHAEFF